MSTDAETPTAAPLRRPQLVRVDGQPVTKAPSVKEASPALPDQGAPDQRGPDQRGPDRGAPDAAAVAAGGAMIEVPRQGPPVANRFRAGQSGNPNGRPKGRSNLRTILQRALEIKVTWGKDGQVTEVDDKPARTMPAFEAAVRQQVLKAAGGDRLAFEQTLKAIARFGLIPAEGELAALAAAMPANVAPAGIALFRGLQMDRLTRDELKELSALNQVVETTAFFALSPEQVERYRELAAKARGQTVAPMGAAADAA